MTSNTPIIGHYSEGHHVTVPDVGSSRDLKFLGNYGSNLSDTHRRKPERRGPVDRWLIDSNMSGVLALTLTEAFYLEYALGCLQVIDDETKLPISIAESWSRFSRSIELSCSTLNFATEYGVYHFFRSRGWVIKTGHNYGTHFLLYKEGPSIDHAQYAVYIVQECDLPEWETILTLQRVTQSVCKRLLLVYVDCPEDRRTPHCIKDMKISLKTFDTKINPI